MKVPTIAAALSAAVLLSGCISVDVERIEAGPAPDGACRADRFVDLIGAKAADLNHELLPRAHRILGPGDVATQDYNPHRLNIMVNADGRVISVGCG